MEREIEWAEITDLGDSFIHRVLLSINRVRSKGMMCLNCDRWQHTDSASSIHCSLCGQEMREVLE